MTGNGARPWTDTLRSRPWRARCRELARLVEIQRAAILNGDLATLADLAARIDAVLSDLNAVSQPSAEPSEEELTRLREAAAGNARLLEAMIEGVSEARDRIDEVQAGRSRLGYDSRGETVTIGRWRVGRLA